jgi:glycosyltransferase involved in cell wall biosynthesis
VKVLIVSLYFPPAGGGGVQRPLKLATHLPGLGIETHVLAPDDPKWLHEDLGLVVPPQAHVHRARYVGPRGAKLADELHGRSGADRALVHARFAGRRLLVPDENVTWALTAVPAARRIVREHGIDVVLTTSPPNSIHLIGAAVKRATGVRWVADLRDSIVAHPHRMSQSAAGRAKERLAGRVADLVARYADAVVTAAEAITEETRAIAPKGPLVTIPNGCDFDDLDGLSYHPSPRFRITHAGSFFGPRSPRPFLEALSRSGLDVVARFAGDFRASDREWAGGLGLGDRLELLGYVTRRRSLELQRDSEALLLLIPNAEGRGRGILSGKVFEYLANERPIIAAVPPDGAAAALIRETGAGVVADPDAVDALEAALRGLVERHRAGNLDDVRLSPETRTRLSRESRVAELAQVLERIAG